MHFFSTDRGNLTCAGRPGSLGYEVKDANTFANWTVDYLKFDSCFTNGTPAVVEYSIMRDALNASGRGIFFSLCGKSAKFDSFSNHIFDFISCGVNVNDMWTPNVGNSWRTTTDIQNYWSSIISNIDLVR